MWITLRPGASGASLKSRLQALGLWTQPMQGHKGQIHGLRVLPHSRPVELTTLLELPEVLDVSLPPSDRPRVDAQAGEALRVGDLRIGPGAAPVLMAGPCSVESEAQIHEAAAMVARHGAAVLRGGVFKPRTSPYAFDGVGAQGLPWMRAAADAHGLKVVTEVMSQADVQEVARYADLFQIGSRNMQNYALLHAVGRAGMPVLLKRGMASPIEDWLLAGEHLLHAGASGVLFCERGLRGQEPLLRNLLDLSAVALLRHSLGQPVVVDPSHAAGRRDLIEPLSRAALAAGASGLIVEAHPDPAQARSDGPQALHEDELERIGRACEAFAQEL